MAMVTWSPTDKNSNIVLSNNNLTATINSQYAGIRATLGRNTGKWYWECVVGANNKSQIGVANLSANLATPIDRNKRTYYSYNGETTPDGLITGQGLTLNNVLGIALDIDNGTLEFYKNGVSQGIAFTNIHDLGDYIYPYCITPSTNTGIAVTANFGATLFRYEMPKGYSPYDLESAKISWFIITKYLICDKNSILYTFNGNDIIQSPSQELNENNYLTNGFDNGTTITEEQWNKVFPNKEDIKILMWTDDMSKQEAKLTYECGPFELTDWLKKDECNLLVYTDDLEKKECKMIYNCNPYKPIDILKKNGNTCNILVKEV